MASGNIPNKKTSRYYLMPIMWGLIGTTVAILLHCADLDRKMEWSTLDLRFSHCNKLDASNSTVFVDLDDTSIDRIGRWPWPREILAGVIDTINECGGRTQMLDILLPSPQPVRYVSEAGGIYTSQSGPLEIEDAPLPVYDDLLLGDAIQNGNNVILAMEFDPPAQSTREDRQIPLIVQKAMSEISDHSLEKVLNHTRSQYPGQWNTSIQEEARKEYLRIRGIDALSRHTLDARNINRKYIPTGGVKPPLVTIGCGTAGAGFVNVEPDADGIVRRIHLLAGYKDRVFPQLSFAVAINELQRRYGNNIRISADRGEMILSSSDTIIRRIPLDDSGRVLVSWNRSNTVHIPLRIPAAIFLLRQAIARDRRLQRATLYRLAEIMTTPDSPNMMANAILLAIKKEVDCIVQVRTLQRQAYQATLYNSQKQSCGLPDAIKALHSASAELDKLAEEFCTELDDLYLAMRPGEDQPDARKIFDTCTTLRNRLIMIDSERTVKLKEINLGLRRLSKMVQGKICLLGSTSTGAADFVPTPVHIDMPGVQVHYHLLNSILSGKFVRPAPWYLNMIAILTSGLLVSLVTSIRPILKAGILVLAIAASFVIINGYYVFRTYNINMLMVSPLTAMALSFLFITMYRQFTEEREKRKIHRMFSQAYSPVLVDKIIEDPDILKPRKRVLSCMFSDLAGFTSMAESLGPEQTVKLLNRYFNSVQETVMHKHRGYLNKFLGDGIFVFFGAPVQLETHASCAILAAIDCQQQVVDLNHTLMEETGKESNLKVRIGITTGEALVGDCGSSNKSDYTAIGDPVNLASRLESACKFFNTRILVDDRTWDEGGCEDIISRPLGRVYISGVRQAVVIHQILGHRSTTSEEIIETAKIFSDAVDRIEQKDFQGASSHLEEILKHDNKDHISRIYNDFCIKHITEPGIAHEIKDPNGVIRLCWAERIG